jgi:DNA polymerase
MQGRAVHLDFESRSTADLRKVGVYRYAETPTTGLWLLRYKFTGGNEVQRWNRGDPLPVDLIDHVASGGIVKAHNATFRTDHVERGFQKGSRRGACHPHRAMRLHHGTRVQLLTAR